METTQVIILLWCTDMALIVKLGHFAGIKQSVCQEWSHWQSVLFTVDGTLLERARRLPPRIPQTHDPLTGAWLVRYGHRRAGVGDDRRRDPFCTR